MKSKLLILLFILLLSSCDSNEYFSHDKAVIIKIELTSNQNSVYNNYKYLITLDATGYNIDFLTNKQFNIGDTVYFVSQKELK